ncbi:MAG: hypothetical protein KDB61_01630 [Planctomycetes bacterium]|nr:hypothetical protein [Planctomycetota bacterium]
MSQAVHPLLLEPSFWENRLSELVSTPASMMSSPRKDLSCGGRRVEEFRMRAHDGQVLWGLISFPTYFSGTRPCCIRAAGPADPLELDPESAEKGTVEILYQAPAGRRLEDRVLDLIQVHIKAQKGLNVDLSSTEIHPCRQNQPADDVLIASQLLNFLP